MHALQGQETLYCKQVHAKHALRRLSSDAAALGKQVAESAVSHSMSNLIKGMLPTHRSFEQVRASHNEDSKALQDLIVSLCQQRDSWTADSARRVSMIMMGVFNTCASLVSLWAK